MRPCCDELGEPGSNTGVIQGPLPRRFCSWRWLRAPCAPTRCRRGHGSARRAARPVDRADVRARGAPRRHGAVRRPRRVHVARRAPRSGARQAAHRGLLRAPRRRHRAVRRARRQAARRRHRRPVRRARRPRGRRRAGRAGGAADAVDARPLRRRRRRRPADPDAHRHQHRRGARRHARRLGLHGDGRRRQHRRPPAGAGSDRWRAHRFGDGRAVLGDRSAASRSPTPTSVAASSPSSRGSSRARRPPAAARSAATSRSSAACTSGPCSTPPCSSSATATAASSPSSARPAPARPAWPTRSSSALEHEAIVLRTACAPYGETNAAGPRRRRAVGAARPRSRRRRRRTSKPPSGRGRSSCGESTPTTTSCAATSTPSRSSARPQLAARPPRSGRRTRRRRRHAHRHAAARRPDTDDRAVGRQPAVGRAEPARPARRRRPHVDRAAVPADHGQRPDPDVNWPPPVERPVVLQVPLGPLSVDEATTLVRSILERSAGRRRRPGGRPELVARGGGNPLFLVELAGLAATCGPRTPSCPGRCAPSSPPASTSCRRRSGRSSTTPPCSAPATRSASLERFGKELGQEFRRSDLDELAADGLFDVDGHWWRFRSAVVREVAYQTLTKRVRAQRHAGVAAVMAERGSPIDEVAHHAATAAELLAELGTRRRRQAEHRRATPSRRCSKRRPRRCATGRLETAVRHASRALDLHRADPTSERELLLVRAEAETERRNFAPADDRRQRGARARRRRRRPSTRGATPGGASVRSPRCRATWPRPGASWTRRSSWPARSATIAGSPTRCGRGGSPRCSAGRSTTPARSSTGRWRSTTRSTTSGATPGRTRTWRGWRSRRATSPTPSSSSSRPTSASPSSATPAG